GRFEGKTSRDVCSSCQFHGRGVVCNVDPGVDVIGDPVVVAILNTEGFEARKHPRIIAPRCQVRWTSMAEVRPFRGLTYNPKKAVIGNVTTQPYDKISNEMRHRYSAMDPHNIIRVILVKPLDGDTPANNVYTRAAATLKQWRAEGVIESMTVPAFWAYFQRFTVPGTTEERVRKGFIGLGHLEDYASKVVYPHERTLAGPKLDRLQLLRHTRTHFEQIFMLYEDREQRIDQLLDRASERSPDIDVTDEFGVSHLLWILDDPSVLEE